jgi:hypothetical protein
MKYCNLYVFVKKENPDLFDILEDMCAVGLFRPKYPVTFVNPSKAVVAKLKKLVDDGEPDLAFEKLQSHFLYGKHATLKGKFVTYNRKEMKSDLTKITKASDFKQWKHDNSMVFNQTNDALLEEGAETDRPKLEKQVKGKGEHDKLSVTREIPRTMADYARNLNGLLEVLKQSSESKFATVCSKLDPNPVIAWHILVKPSASSSEYISDEVFDQWASTRESNVNNRSTTLLREAFASDDYDKSEMAKAHDARKGINDSGFKQTLDSIVSSYGSHTELLEDELRFRMSDMSIDELDFAELELCSWDESCLVLFKLSNSLLNPCLHKIMQDFVASNAFHYTMYNDSIHKKLEDNIVGAGPGAKKIVKILGSKGRKFIKSLDTDAEDEIAKFVSSLNKKQLGSLKKLLK